MLSVAIEKVLPRTEGYVLVHFPFGDMVQAGFVWSEGVTPQDAIYVLEVLLDSLKAAQKS